jgi:ATP-dependent 26S proteasome regulatory subunit
MPPLSFMDSIQSTTSHVTRMIMFNKIKTGDPLVDAFLTTFILGCFSWLVSWVYDNGIDLYFTNISFDDIKMYFYKKNSIVIEGKRSSTISSYNSSLCVSSAYSDRFKALWNYIINNIEKNKTIYRIKENHSNYQSSNRSRIEDARKNYDMFMVYQNKHFEIDSDIYVRADVEIENDNNEKDKMNIKTDKITITIYSYKYSVAYLKKYIDNITEKYLLSIKETRQNKRFIYFLDKTEINTDEESKLDCWREDLFESARTFSNIFFDGKKQLIEKIDFFLQNKSWYYEKGIPYSLGIGLHGPPGTGKTSFIKALANYTNRHIIVISLKTIKTKYQLEKFFFESTYNDDNENNTITWDKKILVFEDIDCIGDIILDRGTKFTERKGRSRKKSPFDKSSEKAGEMKIGDILQAVCDLNETGTATVSALTKEQPITLDDILNLWDGIRETPGRILIISSNHYDKLDPALIRPGRIDITHQLSNASHNTISEIYLHLFGNKIDKTKLEKVKEYFYSPAELINIYVSNKNESEFMNRLLKNIKV